MIGIASKFSCTIFKASLYPAISSSALFFGVVFSLTSCFNLVLVVLIPSIAFENSVLCILAIIAVFLFLHVSEINNLLS